MGRVLRYTVAGCLSLLVAVGWSHAQVEQMDNLVVVLDASGSMKDEMGGGADRVRKMEAAKKAFEAANELPQVKLLKEKVLEPFLANANFRRALKDFKTDDFKTYDKRIRNDVTFLMNNLRDKYGYTPQGAREVCIYVIDNNLAGKFTTS